MNVVIMALHAGADDTIVLPQIAPSLPRPPQKKAKPKSAPVVVPPSPPVVSSTPTVEVAFQAWIREQNVRIIEDMRRTRVLVMGEAMRAFVDEPLLYLPDLGLKRTEIRQGLMHLNDACRGVVANLIRAEYTGEEEEEAATAVPLSAGPFKKEAPANATATLDESLRSLKQTLVSLVVDGFRFAPSSIAIIFITLRWPQPKAAPTPMWLTRHIIMGQFNESLLQWAYDKERAERLAYLMDHTAAYDWRGPNDDGSTSETTPGYRAYQTTAKAHWEDLAPRLVGRNRLVVDRLMETQTPGTRRIGQEKTRLAPSNTSLVPVEWQGFYRARLYQHFWFNLHLESDHPGSRATLGKRTTLAQLTLPLDGLRPSTMLACALGDLPWVTLSKEVEEEEHEGEEEEEGREEERPQRMSRLGDRKPMGRVTSVFPAASRAEEESIAYLARKTLEELGVKKEGEIASSSPVVPRGLAAALDRVFFQPLAQEWIDLDAQTFSGTLGAYLEGLRDAGGLASSSSTTSEMLHALLALSTISGGPYHVLVAMEELMRSEEEAKKTASRVWWAATKAWFSSASTSVEPAYDEAARVEILTTLLYTSLLSHILGQMSDMIKEKENDQPGLTVNRIWEERRLMQTQYLMQWKRRLHAHLPDWYRDLMGSMNDLLRFSGQGPYDLAPDDASPAPWAMPYLTPDLMTLVVTSTLSRTAVFNYLLRNQWAAWRHRQEHPGLLAKMGLLLGEGIFPASDDQADEMLDARLDIGQMHLFRAPFLRLALELLHPITAGAGLYALLLPLFDVPHTWSSARDFVNAMVFQGGIATSQLETLHTRDFWPESARIMSYMEPAGSMLWMMSQSEANQRRLDVVHAWMADWVKVTRLVMKAYQLEPGTWNIDKEYARNPRRAIRVHTVDVARGELEIQYGKGAPTRDQVSFPGCVLMDLLRFMPEHVLPNLWELYLIGRREVVTEM
jgi:hypothetical protein